MSRLLVAALLALAVVSLVRSTVASAPGVPFESFLVETRNVPSATIAGWHLPARTGARTGTVFVSHGFNNDKSLLLSYQWMRDRLDWDMVYFDFREHGASSHRWSEVPTLGYHEIWDVKTVVDWAEQHQLPHPYVMFGPSMGGSIMLRWAGFDPRISAVMAMGPYVTAWDALHKFVIHGQHVGVLADLFVRGRGREMFQAVDLRTAVARRDDLMIWITCGTQDWFGVADQTKILSASRSPDVLKRLTIIPNSGHGDWWQWPKFDGLIESFLSEAKARGSR